MTTLDSVLLSAAILAASQGGSDLSAPVLAQLQPSGAYAVPSAADTLFDLGRFHGFRDAQEVPTRSDFFRGFGWSVVLGPVGGILAVRRSSSAPIHLPEGMGQTFLELGTAYRDGYRSGFEVSYSPRRREATIAGSMVGSLAFGLIVLKVVDLPSRSRFRGELPDSEPTFITILSLPLGR